MVADKPDFEKYPKTCAEFAGVVAKEVSRRLFDATLWMLDRLRHVTVTNRVQRPVRGWEGSVWEVRDGEVDGSVSVRGFGPEGELLNDPAFVCLVAEDLTRFVQDATGRDDVVVRFDLSPIRQFPDDRGPTG